MGRREEQIPLQMGCERWALLTLQALVSWAVLPQADGGDVAFVPPCVASLNARQRGGMLGQS